MKLFQVAKDGGPYSTVLGMWLVEIKRWFSVVLLRFGHGSREAYHSHAFHSVSWILKGTLTEHLMDGTVNVYRPSLKPVFTGRSTFHKVVSEGTTWVISFRGPWKPQWQEYIPGTQEIVTLTHGRRLLEKEFA